MMCLDVGCGKGFHAALLAENFPKSNFTGIDVTLEAVHLANQQRKDNGQTFDNLAFIQMDAGKMDADWENKYDVVTIFDACHDQMRPDLCLKEIYRVLKPGGVFGMLEVNGSSNVYKDKQEMGLVATQMYGCSMFHCLPVSSNSEDALGLGAMWGKERAVKLLKEAGFKDITVLPTPQFVINILYVCKKD
ncbi:methyltransferase domain protein [Ancylostoma caninum]|nr:methyltransferase domain protein [Ancylostoma caninum]